MEKPLKIFIPEDSPDGVDLIERELQRAEMAFSPTVVIKRKHYKNALIKSSPDVILSDHSLPRFNSILTFRNTSLKYISFKKESVTLKECFNPLTRDGNIQNINGTGHNDKNDKIALSDK